jgi:glycosyltransferase involved in cell wall biosynthesis
MDEKMSLEKNAPWVSFCMTTFKRPRFLKEQLQTILKQTFQDFAIIVSDNDTEGSGESVVKEINDPRISYYRNEENLGMVKSFNRSLAKARSEYVVMITDDDPVYPDMLKTLRELTLEYPGYGMYMGGCDIVCHNPTVAKSSRLKVGTNSCLADLPIGTIRTYTGEEFPFAYFKGEIGGHLLWSTGIVKREIAMAIDGMPDFGAPYNTDFGYIVLSGAQFGAVLINTSLGCQVVHGANYGFTESQFDRLYTTPNAFYKWVTERLPSKFDYSGLDG